VQQGGVDDGLQLRAEDDDVERVDGPLMACGGAELAQFAEHRGPVERFDVRCCGVVRADWAKDAQGFGEEAVGEVERG